MHTITNQDVSGLLGVQKPPCVSVYLPTHRSYPDSKEDAVHYRDLVDQAEEALRKTYPHAESRPVLSRLRGLTEDDAFWTQRSDGLAVLASPAKLEVFDLQRPVPERVVVGDSFHIKPLLRIVQSADRFHVLCLQREAVRLYEGNRDGLDVIEPAGVPLTVQDALGTDVAVQRKEQTFPGKSAGEKHPPPRGPNAPPGHAATRDDAKLDTERFFRAVDQAVLERVSRPTGLPLVIAALPEQQAIFRAVSQNPNLIEAGIEQGPGLMSEKELLAAAWKCIEPRYLAQLRQMTDDFETARARALASDDPAAVFRAAQEGRVGILLVEADRKLPGTPIMETDDLLDDLTEEVLRHRGKVVVVPAEQMPTVSGVAAIYRY